MMRPSLGTRGVWMRGQRGLALVTGLWVLVLLSLMAASFNGRWTRLSTGLT